MSRNYGGGDNPPKHGEEMTNDEKIDLIQKVSAWGKSRGITNPNTQLNKCLEELGELASEINHERWGSEEMVDGVGDVFVTLIILCDILGVELFEALEFSYRQIQDRVGRTSDGNFIKAEEEDDNQKVTILKNAFFCKKCKMLVESKSVHDFVKCKCGNSTDGGHHYIRRSGNFEDMEDRSEIFEEENEAN